MNNKKLQNFINLVAFDQNLIALELNIALSEKNLQKLRDESDMIQKKFNEKINEKKEQKKKFDFHELHVKELQDKESHQAAVIEKTKNTKELDAANKELEHIMADRNRQEKKLMQLHNSYQTIEKEVSLLQTENDQKATSIANEINAEQESLKELKRSLDDLSTQRESKIDILPSELIVC